MPKKYEFNFLINKKIDFCIKQKSILVSKLN